MDDLLKRLEKMEVAIPLYAQAKANRTYLEEYKKSLKAILMGRCQEKSAVAREQWAFQQDEYLKLLDGIKEAVETEEKCRWSLEKLKLDVSVWQTMQANERYTKDRL
jgi:hypothetical protein